MVIEENELAMKLREGKSKGIRYTIEEMKEWKCSKM